MHIKYMYLYVLFVECLCYTLISISSNKPNSIWEFCKTPFGIIILQSFYFKVTEIHC